MNLSATDAPENEANMKTPLEKATTTFDVIDATKDINEPIGTLVVIDMPRLEREVLIGSIADDDVQKLLPFSTSLGLGDNFTHIVNKSAYTVQTNSHAISESETLCKRAEYTHPMYYGENVFGTPTCPGCLAKGKAIIVNHLLSIS